MTPCQVIESGSLPPQVIMAKDSDLLSQLDPQDPLFLHFYQWNCPCLTYGYFTDPFLHLNQEALRHYGLQIARRPTGGGIIFHLSDLSFSVLVPANHPHFSLNTLENYAWINQKVVEAITPFILESRKLQLLQKEPECLSRDCLAFCMAKPTQYDLFLDGKKVGGAAQRRTKQGLLHQTSLSLLPPPKDLMREVLKNGRLVLEAMHQHSAALCSSPTSQLDLPKIQAKIKDCLRNVFW